MFPQSFILHQDDFYKPDAEIPISKQYGIADWDCAESINFDNLKDALVHIREKASLPTNLESKEDKNATHDIKVSKEILDKLRNKTADVKTIIALVDGFLLLPRKELKPFLDVNMLVVASRSTLRKRRENRTYVTLETIWEDPPGYFDKIVWPAYVSDHGYLFESIEAIENGDVTKVVSTDAVIIDSEHSSMDEMLVKAVDAILARL